MNGSQIGGILRAILGPIIAYIAAKGWIPVGTLNEIGSAVVAIVIAIWSWKTNSTTAMISTVAAQPEVAKVVTTPTIASADPSPKVTST